MLASIFRGLAIDLLGESLDLDTLRHALAPTDLGPDRAAGRLPFALDGTCLNVLADHFAIAVAERDLALLRPTRTSPILPPTTPTCLACRPIIRSSSFRARVIYGAPMRGIAPCGSCHGSLDSKSGSPWLEGQSEA